MGKAAPSLGRALRMLVDPVYGVATQFFELGASPYAPDVFVSYAEGGPPSYLIGHEQTTWQNCSVASGAAYGRQDACWATLGELAERYCASIYDHADLVRSKKSYAPVSYLPIEEMILFSDAQYQDPGFPFKRFDSDAQTDWVAGYDLANARGIYAPAQLLYLSHEWRNTMLMQTVSTGLACHSDLEKARLSAILELIERDGFASAWLLGMPLPRLQMSAAQRACLSEPTCNALESGVMDITLCAIPNEFGVANIVAFAEHPELGFGTVGAAACLCPYKAIDKAVLESLHGWIGFSQTPSQSGMLIKEDIKTPHDHALYHMQPEAWAELGWFMHEGEDITLADLNYEPIMHSSDDVALRLRAHGYMTCVFDLTTDDVSSLGLNVIRAIVPGLQPLSFGKTPVSEDRRRLQACADFWKWPMPDTLTIAPHPFP